jgi:hypothetical protein
MPALANLMATESAPSEDYAYDDTSKLPPRKKRKRSRKSKATPTGDDHPSEILDEAAYYREKKAALDALPGVSHGLGEGSVGSLIIGALLYGIVSFLCCGIFALLPMLFLGFRVYLVRENTSALIVYAVAGFIASGVGFLFWQVVFLK